MWIPAFAGKTDFRFKTPNCYEISKYSALDKHNAAVEWVESIFSKVENVSKFPQSGRKVPKLDNDEYKELIIGV
jgi:plasmid stabilization system protein ParE